MKFMCDEMQKGLAEEKTYVRGTTKKPDYIIIGLNTDGDDDGDGTIWSDRPFNQNTDCLMIEDCLADDWLEVSEYNLDLFEMMKMLNMGKTVRQKNNKLSLRWNGSMYEVIDPDEVASINVPTLDDALAFFKTHADEAKVKQWMVVE